MSRSGYTDDIHEWDLIRWRGMVASSIRGRRGQKLLKDILKALDAMPEKRLIEKDLVRPDGEVCTLGCVGKMRGIHVEKIDPEDHETLSKEFDVAPCLIQEIEYENDQDWRYQKATPEARWEYMRKWVADRIKEKAP